MVERAYAAVPAWKFCVELSGCYLPTLAVGLVKPFCLLLQDEILGRSRRDAVRLVPASGIGQRSKMRFQFAPGEIVFNCMQLVFAGALEASQGILAWIILLLFVECGADLTRGPRIFYEQVLDQEH